MRTGRRGKRDDLLGPVLQPSCLTQFFPSLLPLRRLSHFSLSSSSSLLSSFLEENGSTQNDIQKMEGKKDEGGEGRSNGSTNLEMVIEKGRGGGGNREDACCCRLHSSPLIVHTHGPFVVVVVVGVRTRPPNRAEGVSESALNEGGKSRSCQPLSSSSSSFDRLNCQVETRFRLQ